MANVLFINSGEIIDIYDNIIKKYHLNFKTEYDMYLSTDHMKSTLLKENDEKFLDEIKNSNKGDWEDSYFINFYLNRIKRHMNYNTFCILLTFLEKINKIHNIDVYIDNLISKFPKYSNNYYNDDWFKYKDILKESVIGINDKNMSKDIEKILWYIYNDVDDFYDRLLSKGFDYIDIGNDVRNNVSYLPKNKIGELKNHNIDLYNNKQRIHTSFGKLIKKLYPYINNIDIEMVTNIYKSKYKKLKKLFFIDIVDGEEIRYWYNCVNAVQQGSLGNSCMKSQHRFDIYVNNPSVCKMIILKDNKYDNLIIGRALLWKTNKGWYMDKIYTSFFDYDIFKNYAEENGFLDYYSYRNKEKLFVRIKMPKIKRKLDRTHYPYLDTFKFYYPNLGILRYEPFFINFKTKMLNDHD